MNYHQIPLENGCKAWLAALIRDICRLHRTLFARITRSTFCWRTNASLWPIATVLLFYSTLPTVASEYTVEGKIRYEIYTRTGGVSVLQEDDFTASVKDCNWHIQKIPRRYLSQGKAEPLGDYGTISSDGTNFYEVLSFNSTNIYGRIGSGTTPYCLTDSKTLVLWYAFASGCHFANQQDKFLINPFLMFEQSNYAKDFRVRAVWQLGSAAPFLPNYIAFDAKPGFEQGAGLRREAVWAYTNVVFSVSEFMEQEGLVLPKKISVDYLSPNPTNKVVLFRSGNISIETRSIRRGVEVTSFRPQNLKFHTVSDMRTIATNTPFAVASFDKAGWPDLQVSETKAKALAVTYKTSSQPRPAKSSRLILITLLLLSAILFIFLRKLSQQKTETTNTR